MRPHRIRRIRRISVAGAAATVAAMAATTLAAALARAVGVDFVVAEGEEPIPLSGFAVVTGVFSALGVGVALAADRWSSRPAERFAQVAIALTAISLAPPFLSAASPGTVAALIGLHLVAAAVMITALTAALRVRSSLPERLSDRRTR